MADCAKCGAYFYRDDVAEPWKRLCLSCWKAERGIEDRPKPKAAPRKNPNDMVAEITILKARLFRLENELAIERARKPAGGVDKAMLKKMRMLCHPDKHGNSAIATEVTQYINNALK